MQVVQDNRQLEEQSQKRTREAEDCTIVAEGRKTVFRARGCGAGAGGGQPVLIEGCVVDHSV